MTGERTGVRLRSAVFIVFFLGIMVLAAGARADTRSGEGTLRDLS